MNPEKRRSSVGSLHLDDSVGMQTSHFPWSAFYDKDFVSPSTSSPVLATYSTLDRDVVKRGYLGKTERSHRRYFVLRKESHTGPRRLEWFVTEERFDTTRAFVGIPALFGPNKQRVIYLRCCVSISKIASTRKGYTMALYTKDQTLLLIAEDQEEQEEWYLPLMKMIQEEREIMEERRALEDGRERLDEDDDGYCTLLPTAVFKEVWPVTVKPRGLGHAKSLLGDGRLCLSPPSLLLSRVGSGGELPPVLLPLLSVRRFGHAEGLFFLELGRSAPHGPGEIWMEVGDQGEPDLAQHVHQAVREAMRELRALPDFSRFPAASPDYQPRPQPRLRARGRDKGGAAAMMPQRHPDPSEPELASVSDGYMDMSVERSLLVAMGTEERSGEISVVTEELGGVEANEMSGWEDDEEEKPGYMMMSPQRRHNSSDDYVTMGSPHTHTLQPAATSSPLQKTFSSCAVNQLNHSCSHAQPDWLLPELQTNQKQQEASELQVSQEASGGTLPQPQQTVFASHPLKIDIVFSLFTPVLPTVSPTQTKSTANQISPVVPAPDRSTVRRFCLSSCLPFCLRAEEKP